MATSWQVFIESVESLKRAEARYGDGIERTAGLLSAIPSFERATSHPNNNSKLCANLGDISVEAQVGKVKKRTQPVSISGDTAAVDVNESLFVPIPKPGQPLEIRVLRVGHMQEDALIGEGSVKHEHAELGRPLVLSLKRRTGKGLEKGRVNLAVTPISLSAEPVVSTTPPVPDSSLLGGMLEKRNRAADKYLGASDKYLGVRQPLLSTRTNKSTGSLVVAIEGIRELSQKLKRPYLLTRVGGKEVLTDPDKLAQASVIDLTHEFEVASLSLDLCIYCYDNLGVNRNAAVGRILLPLACLAWPAGKAPSYSNLKNIMRRSGTITCRFDAQFMPVTRAGDGGNDTNFIDSFKPARMRKGGTVAVPGSGLHKSKAFGRVKLRLELTPAEDCGSQLRSCFNSVRASVADMSKHPDNQQSKSNDAQTTPDLMMNFLNSDTVSQLTRNMDRLFAITRLRVGGPSGLMRWLQESWSHGCVLGVLWFLFCHLGFFPPPLYAWPIYMWLALVLNGLFVGIRRQAEWDDMRHPVYPVWEEELSSASATVKERLELFTKTLKKLARLTGVMANLIERSLNMLSFADGTATILCIFGSWCVASILSLSLMALAFLDPTGTWLSSLTGLILCLAMSGVGSQRQKGECSQEINHCSPRQKKSDVFEVPERLDQILRFVPNTPDLAHRYIATRIQCTPEDAVRSLLVTIVKAKNLRNADWLDGSLSDPYCICKIPGKPKSAITTHVIDDNLNPEWKYKGEIDQYVAGNSLIFEIFDKDVGSDIGLNSDDFLGRAKLTSADFYPDGGEFELKLEEAGEGRDAYLTVEIRVQTPVEKSEQSETTVTL